MDPETVGKAAGFFQLEPRDVRKALKTRGWGGRGRAELLAFCGDSVLRCAVAQLLLDKTSSSVIARPPQTEGDASNAMAALVSNERLAAFWRWLVSSASQKPIREPSSHETATYVEALLQLVFETHGMDTCIEMTERILSATTHHTIDSDEEEEDDVVSRPQPPRFRKRRVLNVPRISTDHVSLIKQWCDVNGGEPSYVFSRTGLDHSPFFECKMKLKAPHFQYTVTSKRCRTKKLAKESASKSMASKLRLK